MSGLWLRRDCVACGGSFDFRSKNRGVFVNSRGIFRPVEVLVSDTLNPLAAAPPCPECGWVQPDAVAKRKRVWHAAVGLGLLAAFVVIGIVGGLDECVAFTYSVAGLVIGIAAVVGVGVHAVVAFSDPNRHPAHNLWRAKALVIRRQLDPVSGPDEDLVDGKPSAVSRWSVLPLAVGAVGAVTAFSPLALAAFKGWPASADTKPEVVSPGDTVRVWFPEEQVNALDGIWNGRPQAVLVGPDGPQPLTATSRTTTWSGRVGGKNPKNKMTTPWVDVRLPDDPQLVGTALEVRVEVVVEYPTMSGMYYDNNADTVTATRRYTLAEPGAAEAYRNAYLVALLGAGLVSACGFVLWGMEGGLRPIPPE